MKFITPSSKDLALLRPDPLLWEQELDVRPDMAEDIELATGIRAGRVYWRSDHNHLYSLELADLGRGHPSTATVYGFWDRYEPRPSEDEIDQDLFDFIIWIAEVCRNIDVEDVQRTNEFARRQTGREGNTYRGS